MGASQPKGFDYYSAHAYFGNYGIVKHAIVGDYQAQFGQGLTFWTGLGIWEISGYYKHKKKCA